MSNPHDDDAQIGFHEARDNLEKLHQAQRLASERYLAKLHHAQQLASERPSERYLEPSKDQELIAIRMIAPDNLEQPRPSEKLHNYTEYTKNCPSCRAIAISTNNPDYKCQNCRQKSQGGSKRKSKSQRRKKSKSHRRKKSIKRRH